MPAPTNLRTNIAQGATGWFSDTNTVHAAVNALTRQAYKQFDVREYGAVGDGITDDTTAFANAAAAMISAGAGTLNMQAGTYKVTSLPTFPTSTATGPLTYAMIGDGSGVTTIMHYGTSLASSLTVNNPLFDPNAGSTGAPQWSGFTIDGTNSSGGTCGIVWGDVSYGSFYDIQIKNFASGDGFFFNNPYGWCEGHAMRSCRSEYNANQLHFDCGSGRVIGTINASISNGATITSITTTALTTSLFSGQRIVIASTTSAPGVLTQTVTVSGAVSAGATTIPVNSTTAVQAYTAGTAKVHWGGYGSYDYWTVDSLYLQANANQHGIVSEVSRGIGENLQRVGSRMRVTGNFHTGATNTGYFMWLKGDDTWNDTVWQIGCEVGGATVAHNSINISSGLGAMTGNGTFILYGFGPSSFTGGLYQFGVTGQVCVNGVSNSDGLTFRQTRRPGYLDVAPGIRPNVGGSAASPVAGQYPATVTAATAWQNTTGTDVFVTIPITGGASIWTAAWNEDVWSGLPSNLPGGGGAALVMAGGPAGSTSTTICLTFLHRYRMWARIDTTGTPTIGAPVIRYLD